MPTTMGIIAGFLSQSVLKYLLNFGTLSYCLSYNAQTDFFNSYKIAINPDCKEPSCQENRAKKEKGELPLLVGQIERPKKEVKKVEHKVNNWGIEMVTDSSKEEQKPIATVKVEESENVEDLMAELNVL